MPSLLDQVQRAQQEVVLGGAEQYVQRHRQRGKLLPRERIDLLLDEDFCAGLHRRRPGVGRLVAGSDRRDGIQAERSAHRGVGMCSAAACD
jgi:acetyl-CoA carboxylase carboxyltransferase component